MDQAKCLTALDDNDGRDVFFDGEPSVRRRAIERYCLNCPVAFDCLAYSLRASPDYGVFGGMEPNVRWDFASKHRGRDEGLVREAHAAQLNRIELKRIERKTNAHRPERVRSLREGLRRRHSR